MNINLEIEKALFELEKEIAGMSQDALRRLELPGSFDIRSSSESYNAGWRTGFRRCLAHIQQAKAKAGQGEK